MTDKTVLLTSGSSWQVPEDFSGANSVECIGGGGGGDGTSGGDGGDYAKGVNLALNPGGMVALQVGAGGSDGAAGGDTVFGDIVAAGGGSGTESAGDVVHVGGAGGTGGGGAGGPTGAGGAADGDTGGTGDGGVTASGADGTEWGTAGSGGGGSSGAAAPKVITTTPYTLLAEDAGKTLQVNLSGQSLIYADASVFAAGDSITIQNTGGGQTSVLGLPRPAAGDFLLAAVAQQSTTAITPQDSTDHDQKLKTTAIDGTSATGMWAGAMQRFWAGTEPVYAWPIVNTNADSAVITQAIGGVDSANPINASGFTPRNSGGTGAQSYTANGITTTADNCMLAYILAVAPNAEMDSEPVFTPPAGFTNPIVARFLQSGGVSILCMAFKEQAAAGATGNVSGSVNLGVTINSGVAGLVAVKGDGAMPKLRNWLTSCNNASIDCAVPVPYGTKLTGDRLPVVADSAGSVTLDVTDDQTIAATSEAALPSIHLTPAWIDGYIEESNGIWTDGVSSQASDSTFLQLARSRFSISTNFKDNKGNTYTKEQLNTSGAMVAYGYKIGGAGGTDHRAFLQSADGAALSMFEVRGVESFVGRQFATLATNGVGSLNTGNLALQAGDLAIAYFYGDATNSTGDTLGVPQPTQHPQVANLRPTVLGMTAVSAFIAPADGNYSETFTFPGTANIEGSGAVAAIFGFHPSTPPPPGITLSHNLPTSLRVGDAVDAEIVATLVGGASGPVMITASPLPDGVSAGTVADNGDGTYTLPVTGTATTEQTVAVEIAATNGTLDATGLEVSIVVSEAPNGALPTLTGHAGVSTSARVSSLTFPFTGAGAGDYALVTVNRDGTTSPTTPTDWTLLNTGTSSVDGQRASIYGKALTSTDITAGSVTITLNGSNWATGTISTWSGVNAAGVTNTVNPKSTRNPKPVTMTALGVPSVGANSILVASFCRDSNDPHEGYPAAPSGWTLLDGTDDSLGWSNMSSSYTSQAAAGNAANATALDSTAGGGWIAFMVALPPA